MKRFVFIASHAHHWPVGRQRLRGWLSSSGLRALCTRVGTRPPRTTQADPQAIAAANKLANWPAATSPKQIWVGDITYLALATGQWAYLACWCDTFSRHVVVLARERVAAHGLDSDRF